MKSTDEIKSKKVSAKKETDHSHIAGWGVDADPKNDPTFPMKDRSNKEHEGYNWERPPLQERDIEILTSVERPNITAIFGTSAPPSGLSGVIRRKAFKYSESSYGRWLPLMLADRVNAIEGLIDDVRKGRFPNIIAERGWRAEWKYNRKAVVRKMLTVALVGTAVLTWFVTKRLKNKSVI